MKVLILISFFVFLSSCMNAVTKMESGNKIIAENFLRGLYGCEPSVVDKYASDSIVVSYPVFEKLFNKVSFHGKQDVKEFAKTFCSRWEDAQTTIHESLEEENSVILVWSFKGNFVGENIVNGPPKNSENSWGGITLFHFDDVGKIFAEIGEESSPGPFHRLNEN